MEEQYDEIMGPSPRSSQQRKTASPPPPPPPTESSVGRRGSGAPPPSNAFVHTNANDRWAQYERDSKLEQESARAHANAVASAAERAASMDSVTSSRSNSARARYDAGGLPPHERVRAEALKVLEAAGDDVSDITPYNLHSTRTGGLTTGKDEPFSFRRSSSSGLGGSNREAYSFRRSSSSSISTGSGSARRTPAALAGLDLKNASAARSEGRKGWTIHDDDDLDDEDLVDIVDTENRITSTIGGYRDDPNDAGAPYSDDERSSNKSKSSWSSRYSVDQYLSGGVTTKDMLDKMDREQQRLAKSARNMFMTSPSTSPKENTSSNIFGSGFKFRQDHANREYDLRDGATVWSDRNFLTGNGNSLQDTLPNRSGNNAISQARRKRRICVAAIVAVCLAAIIGISVGATSKNRGGAPANPFSYGNSDGKGTTFYVVANTPYGAEEETKLKRDLAALPGDAAFVIHLGNIQDAAVTMCPENAYEDAAAVLSTSPVPLFVLPGQNDWNACPMPESAWNHWTRNFLKFERYFEPDFLILYQKNVDENFSFLSDGVLFIGLHLVGGRIYNQKEWDARHAKNVEWVGENLHTIFKPDDFRAVVLLGNARPSNQQRTFFNEVVVDIERLGKPFVYIHANAGDGTDFEEYKPYSGVDNLIAVQIEDGGLSPPLRVSVDFGGAPFQVGRG